MWMNRPITSTSKMLTREVADGTSLAPTLLKGSLELKSRVWSDTSLEPPNLSIGIAKSLKWRQSFAQCIAFSKYHNHCFLCMNPMPSGSLEGLGSEIFLFHFTQIPIIAYGKQWSMWGLFNVLKTAVDPQAEASCSKFQRTMKCNNNYTPQK